VKIDQIFSDVELKGIQIPTNTDFDLGKPILFPF